jgi:uncharacterized phage-associated protein
MAVEFAFSFAKAQAALLYLANKNLSEFTKGKACKLIFLADKKHLVNNARPVTGDWYAAMAHGPVPSRILELLDEVEAGGLMSREAMELSSSLDLDRSFQYPRLRPTCQADLSQLSESDIEALDSTVAAFGQMSFTQLRGLTHETPAYENAWRVKKTSRGVMTFEDFFEEDGDARSGVREEMLENDALRKVFPDPAWF